MWKLSSPDQPRAAGLGPEEEEKGRHVPSLEGWGKAVRRSLLLLR